MACHWVSATFVCLCIFEVSLEAESLESICKSPAKSGRTLKISVRHHRNETGDLSEAITAWAESANSSDIMDFDLTHKVYHCDGKRVIYIQGVVNAPKIEEYYDKLKFHTRCGKNVAIIDKGETIQKINLNDPHNSVVFTNRPLSDNEIFELKLEKRNPKITDCIGIGVMTRTPTDVDILPEMYKSPYAWIYHHTNIYSNNAAYLKDYGKNLDDLQVGDTVGVMRSEFGVLHFFVNGVDQGPAVSNVPPQVYGVFELWYSAVRASLVDTSSRSS